MEPIQQDQRQMTTAIAVLMLYDREKKVNLNGATEMNKKALKKVRIETCNQVCVLVIFCASS
jgi:hypothetical protein